MSDEDDLVEWEGLEAWEDGESFEDRVRISVLLCSPPFVIGAQGLMPEQGMPI
jgi:hypothetical protein